jgi:hypothetical protein
VTILEETVAHKATLSEGEERKLKKTTSSKRLDTQRTNSVAGLLFSQKQSPTSHKFAKFPSGITVNLWCEYCKGYIFSVPNQESYCCESRLQATYILIPPRMQLCSPPQVHGSGRRYLWTSTRFRGI